MRHESRSVPVLRRHLKISGVKVISVQASVDSDADQELEIEWSTRADHVGARAVFVLGNLKTRGNQATSSVAVVAYCSLDEDFTSEITEEVLKAAANDTSVPHVLYDIAAATAQQVLGTVQMKGSLPRATPKATWMDIAK